MLDISCNTYHCPNYKLAPKVIFFLFQNTSSFRIKMDIEVPVEQSRAVGRLLRWHTSWKACEGLLDPVPRFFLHHCKRVHRECLPSGRGVVLGTLVRQWYFFSPSFSFHFYSPAWIVNAEWDSNRNDQAGGSVVETILLTSRRTRLLVQSRSWNLGNCFWKITRGSRSIFFCP